MEKTVRILNQSGLMTRQYPDKKTGEQKVMNSVTLKLTDGIDTFLGEITGERADISIGCFVRWWFASGTPSRRVNTCRPRRSMWTRST